MNSGNLIS